MRPATRALRQARLAHPTAAARRLFSSSPARLEKYGFIGLGQMGYQMAKNLQNKLTPADTVRLFDINKAAVQKLASEVSATGAAVEVVSSVADAAKSADYVVTVLPEPVHVKGVYKEILAGGLAPASTPSKKPVFVDCSTIDPSTSRAVAATVQDAGGDFVDAPMSGGVVGATAGTLTFMLGSPQHLVPAVEPLLLHMGRRVLLCGDQGAGLSAKLANNYLLAINNIGTAEAMHLGVQWGLDPKVLASVINVSTGKCWPSEVNNPVAGVVPTAPANRDYAGGFGISLMKKDLKLAIAAAEEAGAKLALADSARGLYEAAEQDESCKGRDFSVVYRYLGGKE
ncbi:3-hydroxyisobutyrate dehydrogenase [Sporothrix schenckii 1099-18]|uniref:3-hydroxyisobutyrate dehydrogenase n=2 Tax=Sporothrix schenckii TaxID=29908 RepID=U7Q3T8_SPOS1|nr:3-hydroxyisobutyrate dehydrogenase [Sporothrix schenckii 1099-18]ERT02493.1 3-hydroxyisobutyrate dehydrogenase [Sporothrix schenckii ATCC 58251]KJR80226.1 3-hydroxyisobutyrate dehydrogenase [Sporothrix schenckii 1099-18]